MKFDYGSNRTRIRKFAIFDFVYTVTSANIDQSVPNLATIYLSIRSDILIPKSSKNIRSYLPLNLEKLLNPTLYTLASTNNNQSAPNLVKMYVTIRSQMSWIMDLIGLELSELFTLEFTKIAESDFVYMLACTNVDQLVPNNIYDEILDEFDYRSSPTVTSGVICP